MKRNSLFLALAQAAAFSSYAATIRVTTNNDVDTMECTLRDAIVSANTDTATGACDAGSGADTIEFNLVTPATITLGSELPTVTDSLTISGPGSEDLLLDLNSLSGLSFDSQTDDSHTISGITVQNSYGDAVLAEGGSVTIEDVSVLSNTASTELGVIRLFGTVAEIRDSTVSGSYAALTAASAVYAKDSQLTIASSTFSDNVWAAFGGAVRSDGGSLDITGSTFRQNFGTWGGAIYAQDVGVVAIHGSTFYDNSGLTTGGIHATSSVDRGEISISNSLFSDQYGGAIGIENQALDIRSTTIQDTPLGVAISSIDSDLTADDVHILGNAWGGLRAEDSAITITNSVVSGNTSDRYGGIDLTDSVFYASQLTVSDNANTHLLAHGGGIRHSMSSPSSSVDFELIDSSISGNTVGLPPDLSRPYRVRTRSGGGVALSSSQFRIAGTTFSANTAEHYGGGVYLYESNGQFSDCSFSGNTANIGGGLRVSTRDSPMEVYSVEITNARIDSNRAYLGGGAAGGSSTFATMRESTVWNNSAVSFGGLVGVQAIRESTIYGNTAIAVGAVGSAQIVENSTISGNSAPYAPAIYVVSTEILHSTITGNLGNEDQYAVEFPFFGDQNRTATVVNSIISSEFAVCSDRGTVITEGANHFSDTSCDGIDSGDPMLTEVASNGGPTPTQHPRAGSPVVDAADPAFCPPFDQRGEIRGATPCDIGAVEVVDINQPPRIDDQSFVIDSGFVPDDLVGPIEFSDPEMLLGADPLSIIGPDHGFRVEADGMVFVDSAIVPGVTTLMVEVTDPGGLSDRATIVIDVVEFPLFGDGFEQ